MKWKVAKGGASPHLMEGMIKYLPTTANLDGKGSWRLLAPRTDGYRVSVCLAGSLRHTTTVGHYSLLLLCPEQQVASELLLTMNARMGIQYVYRN